MIYLLLAIGGVQSVITTAIFLSFPKGEKKIIKTVILLGISVSIFVVISNLLLQMEPQGY